MKYCALILLISFFETFAQKKPVEITPSPEWVKPVNYSNTITDTSTIAGGYYDLLVDEQLNQLTQETHSRYAQLIVSENGLGNVSPISVSYDPAFQNLTFHSIDIIRNGKRIQKLKTTEIEILRREQNLDRAIYDGELTAVFNLQDLQVGDQLEYSYTIKGSNPVFENKFFRSYYFNFGVPVKKIYYRLLLPPTTKIYHKEFNSPPRTTVTQHNLFTEYEWLRQDVPALIMEESTPAWYDPYDRIQITEFQSWADVAKWAHKLFDLKEDKKLIKQIPELEALPSQEQQIKRVIQFIQDEVRYLSFSNGIHGFKPHSPEKILNQRFGDCKDKSLLLAVILRNLGMESYPVLVNSSYGPTLDEALPSPGLFDHCIVQFKLNDSTYWIDPTISFQRGPLNKLFVPDYRLGLVIDPSASSLATIRQSHTHGSLAFNEIFEVQPVGQGATLKVISTYNGNHADYMRDYFKSNSLSSIDERYLNFYATDYPDIELAAPVEFTDDEVHNEFTTTELYEINSFWTQDSANHIQQATVYPRNLAGYLTSPATKIRRMPFSITYPLNIIYSIKLILPEEWSVSESEKTIESTGFKYTSKTFLQNGNEVHKDYTYLAKKRYLEKNEIRDYIKKVNETSNDMTLTLTYKDESKVNKTFNTPYLLIILMLFIPGFFALKKMYEFDPEPKGHTLYNTIGGWLILPGIGLCLTPFRMIYDFLNIDYFNYSNWRILTDPNFGAYDVALGSLILIEMIINLVLLFYSVVLIFLFFKRRSSVPLLAAIFYGSNFIFLLADGVIGGQYIGMDNETITAVLRSLFGAAIWIPYFLISERSKGTFTQRNFIPTEASTNSSYP